MASRSPVSQTFQFAQGVFLAASGVGRLARGFKPAHGSKGDARVREGDPASLGSIQSRAGRVAAAGDGAAPAVQVHDWAAAALNPSGAMNSRRENEFTFTLPVYHFLAAQVYVGCAHICVRSDPIRQRVNVGASDRHHLVGQRVLLLVAPEVVGKMVVDPSRVCFGESGSSGRSEFDQ